MNLLPQFLPMSILPSTNYVPISLSFYELYTFNLKLQFSLEIYMGRVQLLRFFV